MTERMPDIREMTGWPGTPPYDRIIRAGRFLNEAEGKPPVITQAGRNTPKKPR